MTSRRGPSPSGWRCSTRAACRLWCSATVTLGSEVPAAANAVLALRLARGASRARLQAGVAAGTLCLTLPATLLGVAATFAATLSLTGIDPVAFAASLVTPAMLAVLDLVVVVLAPVSVWLVLRRGVVASSAAVGVDLLLVAMPLLVALAVSVISVRLYPVLLGVARVVGATGRGAISVIGVHRASRDRGVASVVVTATLVATAAAVSSLSLLAVVDSGLSGAARDRLGAEVRASGPGATGDLAAEAATLPEPDATISVGGVAVTAVGSGRTADGYGVAGSWVIVPSADAERFTQSPAVDTVLIGPVDGVDPAAAGAALA